MPAAVINIGNMRGDAFAARSTPLYPAIVAIDDSASMLCARVMRASAPSRRASRRWERCPESPPARPAGRRSR